jgi:hypothetical protein
MDEGALAMFQFDVESNQQGVHSAFDMLLYICFVERLEYEEDAYLVNKERLWASPLFDSAPRCIMN